MQRVLLINPTITSSASARFPLAVLNLAAALEPAREVCIIDGNVDRNFVASAQAAVRGRAFDAVGVSVMGGPQLPRAISVSRAIRAASPETPIVWGGQFPTICPPAVLNCDFVDFAIRGQGEDTFIELLDVLGGAPGRTFSDIRGLSWRADAAVVHNADRAFSRASLERTLPYERLHNPRQYLKRTYLGRRTAGYQAALGCRFRCTFCGVAEMFRGKMALPTAARLSRDLEFLQRQYGADAIQFFDHNFFDREVDMVPLLEVLAGLELPWWCFARADALVNLSQGSWNLVRKSRLKMAYIGAESPNDSLLHDVRKGTRADQTFAVVEKCRSQGVIPELSFMLAPPQDPEGETERTFEFIRQIKRLHPATEIMLYVYTPLPPRQHPGGPGNVREARPLYDVNGHRVEFPSSAEEWAEPQWVSYWCHQDAPWVSERLKRRILDFTTVLGCRFPTVTDIRSPGWGKAALRTLATWRYRFRRYERPWELDLSKRFVKLWDPRVAGL